MSKSILSISHFLFWLSVARPGRSILLSTCRDKRNARPNVHRLALSRSFHDGGGIQDQSAMLFMISKKENDSSVEWTRGVCCALRYSTHGDKKKSPEIVVATPRV
ncbi:hypothetical protein HDK77DRAFT_444994 [Phyllosticta capitalensis]